MKTETWREYLARLERRRRWKRFLEKLVGWIPLVVPAAIMLVTLAAPYGCRVPPPETPGGRVLECGTEAVRRCWPTVLPAVNSCLAQPGEDAKTGECLATLIQPTVCGAEEVVRCMVKKSGDDAGQAAARNPDDVVSARMVRRARGWLSR